MTLLKPMLRWAGVSLGSLGAVIGFAAILVLWTVNARLERATVSVFRKVDQSLTFVRQRLSQSQQRVAAARITAQEVETALRDWSRQQAAQRIESRTDAAEKTQRLASALRQVDNWLEVSESSVALLNELLLIAQPTGPSAETTLLSQVREDISSVRARCAEASELVDKVYERVAAASDEQSPEERITQAAQLLLRATATFSSIDSRLKESALRLSAAQRRLQEAKAQTRRWIFAATIVSTLLLCWMAAGQIALLRLSSNAWRQP